MPTVRDAPPARPMVDHERIRRLARDRERIAVDVRHRPEESSPAIRRLLGYDQAPRPPHRWEQRLQMTVRGAELVNVDAGPVDPEPPRRLMRSSS